MEKSGLNGINRTVRIKQDKEDRRDYIYWTIEDSTGKDLRGSTGPKRLHRINITVSSVLNKINRTVRN
jgi:hypothetical protein